MTQITDTARETYQRGPHWVAVAAAIFTWPLLFVGGLVTSYKVGMAVPDWPTTFGINMFLYDFFNSPWGVFIEHTHRLYGAAVGLATIILVLWFMIADRTNQRMVGLVWFALIAVIGQGLLGGLRVNYISTTLAAVHGSTGQAFFGLMVAIAVLTSRSWRLSPTTMADPSHIRQNSVLLVGLVYGQELLGVWLRHFPSRGGLVVHAVVAMAVIGQAIGLILRIHRDRVDLPLLIPSTRCLAITLAIQVALGLGAWWVLEFPGAPKDLSALLRTGHQANAALLLGASLTLTLRANRHLVSQAALVSPPTHALDKLEAVR